jgi:site-specific DNA-methyltransferase (adenine-specific)
MSMCEYAWCSMNANAKCVKMPSSGIKDRFHPTQKPVALYEWIYKKYTKDGYKVLDTHMGSGSSRIAAYNLGLEYVGCEINKNYFDKQEERFLKHISQQNLF